VLATHGVLRLEPTLHGSLRRLMTARQRPPGPGRPFATVAGSDKITVTSPTVLGQLAGPKPR
jgi:hypothetical protein